MPDIICDILVLLLICFLLITIGRIFGRIEAEIAELTLEQISDFFFILVLISFIAGWVPVAEAAGLCGLGSILHFLTKKVENIF